MTPTSAFLDDYEALCIKHGVCLSHEDCQGAFLLVPFDDEFIIWVREARIEDFDQEEVTGS